MKISGLTKNDIETIRNLNMNFIACLLAYDSTS